MDNDTRKNTPIRPIVHCPTRQLPGGLWAVAGQNSTVLLVSDDGRFADRIDIGFTAHGIELAEIGQTVILLASDGNRVQAWNVRIPAHAAMIRPVAKESKPWH